MKIITGEEGATAIEYAIMAAAIAGVIALTVFAVGVKVSGLFVSLNTIWK